MRLFSLTLHKRSGRNPPGEKTIEKLLNCERQFVQEQVPIVCVARSDMFVSGVASLWQ